MEIIITLGILVGGLVALVFAADYFTTASEKLGRLIGIPQFIIGVTVVSIGTSLPELVTSLISVFEDETAIVAGNAFGSNIANILLIGGVVAVISRIVSVDRDLINLDLPLLAIATTLAVFVALDGMINFIEALLLLAGFVVYLAYTLKEQREPEPPVLEIKKTESKLKLIVIVAVSAVFVYLGAKYTIDGIIRLGDLLSIQSSLFALTVVAFGTSLPEIVVSVRAALKKNFEIALGNIYGSSIFNGLFVIGLPALIKPLEVDAPTLTIAIPMLIAATILFIFSGISRKLHVWEGAFYILLYVFFVGKIFNFF